MPSASASRCCTSFCLVWIWTCEVRLTRRPARPARGSRWPLDHEGRVAALAAGLEGRGAEELVAQRVGEPLAQGRLDPLLDRDEQVGVAVEVGDVGPAGLLLQRVLDLLAERVLDQAVPPVGV